MVIGAVGLTVVLASTDLLKPVVLIEVFVGEDAFIIDEVIVVVATTAINHLPATTTTTTAVKHPSKHNVY